MTKKIFEFKQSVNDPSILDMYLYGNIEAGGYDWWNDENIISETSADYFKEELAKYPDAKQINVFVNSFGGSVFEAMSIRNQLKRHSALVIGVVDGFAASAASFILTACDTVKMYSNTTQMLHNMWNVAVGNSKQLRKAADDMDVMMAGNRQAYLEKAGGKLTEERLMEILENETWLTAAQCLEIGLCDEVIAEEVNLKTAEELVQKMNVAMQQRINCNEKLVAQLKEFAIPEKVVEKVIAPKTNMERIKEMYNK